MYIISATDIENWNIYVYNMTVVSASTNIKYVKVVKVYLELYQT